MSRLAAAEDIPRVADLWRRASEARHREIGLLPGPAAGAQDGIRLLTERLADGGFAVLLDDGSDVVAMAVVLPAREADGAGAVIPGLAHVSMVAVRPESWGSRYGERVLADAVQEAVARGFGKAQLWAHVSNARARRLYERTGWRWSGRVKDDENGEPIRQYVKEIA